MRFPTLAPPRARLACALLLALGFSAAQAADLHWRDRPFQILAADKPLPDFLREIAASQGTTAVIDPKVGGTLSGRFADNAQRVLDNVCATNGLTWYFDGALLYVEPASESRSEVIAVGDPASALQTLRTLNIVDSRYPVTIVEHGGQGSLRVSGPRRYVDLVHQAVHQVDDGGPSDARAEVRVFPLKYAWAGDIKINRNGRETSVSGVATLLRDIFTRDGASSRNQQNAPVSTGVTRELKLHSTGDTVNALQVELPALGTDTSTPSPDSNHGRLPQFEANTGLNAIIVRDLPDHMGQYARLIQSMDVRPRLVEIEVTIMDIGKDNLDELGFDWRAHGSNIDFQVGHGTAPPLTWGQGPANEVMQTGALTPLGTMFSAAIGSDATSYLLARVNALAQTGDANLVARPKVLTLDNNEAVLENLQQFYVRVNGYQDAQLFSVTTGTALRVTPMIVDESSQRGVMMSIDIEDGDVDGSQTVDQIPVIDRRTVNTQALVDEGQSLLIAGFSTESRTAATAGVPLLKDVPFVGALFRFDQKEHKHMERFYLLTPRLVSTQGGPMPTLPDPKG
jgi:type III secretion protein C